MTGYLRREFREQIEASRYLRWDIKFTRRDPTLYRLEDKKPFQPEREVNPKEKLREFFNQQTHGLRPKSYNYQKLRDFLDLGDPGIFGTGLSTCLNVQALSKMVVFDERTDDQSLNTFTSRQWQGYEQYPPRGIAEFTAVLNPMECYKRLSLVREHPGSPFPERRSIYIRDLTPLCAAALIFAVSRRYADFMRDFLSRYVSSRVYFGVSMDYPIKPSSPFALEFHIPYFAIRKSSNKFPNSETCNMVGRRSGLFTDSFTRSCEPGQKEYFHEAQISVLLVGIDEWVWTLYCLVETHFEERDNLTKLEEYVSDKRDAPSGQSASYEMPIWNPREYFLLVLCRRMDQATMEWQNLVEILDHRLKDLENDIFVKPSEDSVTGHESDLSLINDYTWAIQVLQLFTNLLVKTIESWQEFSRMHLATFHPGENQVEYSSQVPSYLQRIDRDVSELRYFHTLLGQRIASFEGRRTTILNTLALMETRLSNTQAADIGLLTRVTVVYLPLTLVTAIFSMSFVQTIGTWGWYLTILIPFTLLSLVASFNLQIIIATVKYFCRKFSPTRPRVSILAQLEAGLNTNHLVH